LRSRADAPGYTITSYKHDIQDVRIVDDLAFEWGLFDAAARPSADKPVVPIHGEVLRILHRESNGDWKFSRVAVDAYWDKTTTAPPKK